MCQIMTTLLFLDQFTLLIYFLMISRLNYFIRTFSAFMYSELLSSCFINIYFIVTVNVVCWAKSWLPFISFLYSHSLVLKLFFFFSPVLLSCNYHSFNLFKCFIFFQVTFSQRPHFGTISSSNWSGCSLSLLHHSKDMK